MGQRAAKDETERRGHHIAEAEPEPRAPGLGAEWADPRSSWPAEVVRWYRSLDRSGQRVHYQQSDADQAWILADVLARGLRWNDRQLIRIWLTGSRELLTTESSRRGAHVRLDPAAAPNAELAAAHDEAVNVIRAQFGERPA